VIFLVSVPFGIAGTLWAYFRLQELCSRRPAPIDWTGNLTFAIASPNKAGLMNSLPRQHRGAGSGVNATFQNSAQVLSIGIFFTLVIIGLSANLPASLGHGLTSEGVPRAGALKVANMPPVPTLFAAFLGYSPLAHLLPAKVIAGLSKAHASTVLGRSFFPHLAAKPFGDGLHTAFDFAAAGCLVAAVASWTRGQFRLPERRASGVG